MRRGFLAGTIDDSLLSDRRKAALWAWLDRQLLRLRRREARRVVRSGVRSIAHRSVFLIRSLRCREAAGWLHRHAAALRRYCVVSR